MHFVPISSDFTLTVQCLCHNLKRKKLLHICIQAKGKKNIKGNIRPCNVEACIRGYKKLVKVTKLYIDVLITIIIIIIIHSFLKMLFTVLKDT